MSRLQSQNPIIPERIKKTISRVDCENTKGLIQRVTVTGAESLSKSAGCERLHVAQDVAVASWGMA